jgi:hypothetical protein
VKMFLLERGIDVERLPNPLAYIEDKDVLINRCG